MEMGSRTQKDELLERSFTNLHHAKIRVLIVFILFSISCVQQPEAAYCVKVFDGDTFELENGEVVRLIGIDAPESSQPGWDSARDYLSFLVLDKKVTLVAGSKKRDEHGRLLQYVYVESMCVNEEMIRNGYAEVRYLSEDDPHLEYYIQLEREAESRKAGLWEYRVFQPRSDLNWEGDISVITWKDADKYYGQYVIVEGTIVDTYNSGEVCFLNFHSSQQYLTAVIFACDFPNFPERPEIFYLGKGVHIIGIIKQYKGRPEIIVKTPDQIMIRKS